MGSAAVKSATFGKFISEYVHMSAASLTKIDELPLRRCPCDVTRQTIASELARYKS
jgi:hypothetical protein